MFELYPEQSTAVTRLEEISRRSRVSFNLSETGTGKTLMLLEFGRRQGLKPFVIVPKAGVSQFKITAQTQCVELTGCLNLEALKTGKYPQLKRATMGDLKYLWQLPRGSMVCIDEAHQMGGIDSDNAFILATLKAYPIHVHLMSATLASDPLRMRAAGFLAGLHPFKPEGAFYEWCRSRGCGISPWTQRWEFEKTALRAQHLQRLHEDLAPLSVRLRTSDIPGFPENDIIAKLVNLNERDTNEIQALYAEMRDVVRTCDAATAEVELLRRRQRAEFLKAGVLADMAEDIIDAGKSSIIFVCFRDTLAQVDRLLKAKGIESVQIYGGQSENQREAAKLAFQQNLNTSMLAMIQAGGISINLQDLHGRARETLICPSWDPVHTHQCLGRAPRAGGLSKVVQTFVLAAETVEENVYKTVMRKMGNIKSINDGFVSADERSAVAAQAATEGLEDTLK
jgi:hypothetical protein